jgi:hypothetical protein
MRRGTNPTGAGQTWQNRAGMPSSVPPIAAPGAWLPTNCARIPFYGSPINSILRIGKQFYSGLNRYGEFYIYTNRGLGTFWLRIRINCRPEISRFRLRTLVDDEMPHEPPAPKTYRRHRRQQRTQRTVS